MQIENFVELSSLINISSLISAIALLVTIAGWIFTARKQKELIQLQIQQKNVLIFGVYQKPKLNELKII